MAKPIRRPRRLRSTPAIRNMVRETHLHTGDFVLPLFVSDCIKERKAIASMPGVFQLTVDELVQDVAAAVAQGVESVLLFGIPAKKDHTAQEAYSENGIMQRAVKALRKELPDLVIITDVCLCEYMDHGHCGIVHDHGHKKEILNDESVELLCRAAVSHAAAGANVVAPSDMMDGRVGAIRHALDEADFHNTVIMSYSAKFCSAFYGPFREAAESAPQFGDRRSYQMDPANALEAIREVELDIKEAADIVMVKPGLPYLDILWRIKERFQMPTAVYNVSGEYAMLKAAAEKGWIDERSAVMELMTSFKRAGADLIITYWAREVCGWLKEK